MVPSSITSTFLVIFQLQLFSDSFVGGFNIFRSFSCSAQFFTVSFQCYLLFWHQFLYMQVLSFLQHIKLFFSIHYLKMGKNFFESCFCPIFFSNFNKKQKHRSVFLFCCKTLISQTTGTKKFLIHRIFLGNQLTEVYYSLKSLLT